MNIGYGISVHCKKSKKKFPLDIKKRAKGAIALFLKQLCRLSYKFSVFENVTTRKLNLKTPWSNANLFLVRLLGKEHLFGAQILPLKK